MRSLTALLCFAITVPAQAQHDRGGQATTRSVPAEAAQFAFLLGQWDLVVRPEASGLAARIHGVPKMAGTWKAWRALDGFGIEDELRITDASGNPRALSHAVRYYDAAARGWTASSIDVYRGRFTSSSSQWGDGAMTSTSRGTDADGKAYVTRSRFHDITPTAFKFRQDRSTDEGKTWKEGVLSIEAKRVAAVAPR